MKRLTDNILPDFTEQRRENHAKNHSFDGSD